MQITILGSCSGTEPMPGRHHTSWTLELDGELYWFDAGETCSYTAHLMDIDLLKTRGIFISHPHMDHVGGLPNLLWTIRKLTYVKRILDPFTINIYSSVPKQVQAMIDILKDTEGDFVSCFDIRIHQVSDGVLMSSPLLVEAKHNEHMPMDQNGLWRSFSYRIKAKDKYIVYSGDISSIEELGSWKDTCHILMMETGHHCPIEVCKYLEKENAKIEKLLFVHHGRTILFNEEETLQKCREATKIPVEFAQDKMVISC